MLSGETILTETAENVEFFIIMIMLVGAVINNSYKTILTFPRAMLLFCGTPPHGQSALS